MNDTARFTLHDVPFRLPKVKGSDWRLTEPLSGEIVGLPTSRGVLVATNGLDVLIRRPTDYFLGHLMFFVCDKESEEIKVLKTRLLPKSPRQKNYDLSEYV